MGLARTAAALTPRSPKPVWRRGLTLCCLTLSIPHPLQRYERGKEEMTLIAGTENNDKLAKDLINVGARAGESYWQLPYTEEYRDLTRGQYADLQNIYNPGQGAGTVAGGVFLSFFIGDRDWVHLDIAATAWKAPARPYLAKGGGSGVGARTFLELLRS